MKRIFLIVLDSLGAGYLPDADKFGDVGASTLGTLKKTGILDIPNLERLGIGNIDGLDFLGRAENPTAAYCKIAERSMGKDTTTGHWEIAGVVSEKPFPTYKNGFPKEIIDEFSRLTGRGVLCNKPYSGTEVIKAYGEEHMRTGKLIVYTSADSVFQIAAHEEIVPLETLYEYCRIARKILVGDNAVGRVIARPFIGTSAENFKRTANRHDFSLEPTGRTMLDAIKDAGKDVIAVGKITDIFAGRGVTETLITHGNTEGIKVTLDVENRDFDGLCFVNLVDFDMLYGHRNDAIGYAKALNEFDAFLPEFISKMRDGDVLMITADHGCDPGDVSTDHTREYIPLIVYGHEIKSADLGVRSCFADIGQTVCDMLSVPFECAGKSFRRDIVKGENT